MPTPLVDVVPYVTPTVSTGAAYSLVSGEIQNANDQADSFIAELQEAIENITATVPFEPDFSALEKNIPDLILNAFPLRPSVDFLLNNAWPDDKIPDPNFVDVNVDTSYDRPVAPDPIDPVFEFVQKVYSSEIYRPLVDALLRDLSEGGTGFTELAYQAILNREADARKRINDRRRVAEDRILGVGGMMPNGFAADVKLNTEADIAREDSIALAGIVAKDFEITDLNTRFVKEALQSFELALMADFNSSEERRFAIARGTKEVALAIFAEGIRKYLGDWEGVKAQLEGAKIEAEIGIEKNKAEVEKFLGRAKVLDSRIAAIAAENKSKSESAQAKASVYASEVQAVAVETNALLDEVRLHKDLYLADLQRVLSENDLNLRAYTSAQELDAEKLIAISKILAQAVASALGKTNIGASYGASQQESMRHGYSLSSALSDTYRTDLTAP